MAIVSVFRKQHNGYTEAFTERFAEHVRIYARAVSKLSRERIAEVKRSQHQGRIVSLHDSIVLETKDALLALFYIVSQPNKNQAISHAIRNDHRFNDDELDTLYSLKRDSFIDAQFGFLLHDVPTHILPNLQSLFSEETKALRKKGLAASREYALDYRGDGCFGEINDAETLVSHIEKKFFRKFHLKLGQLLPGYDNTRVRHGLYNGEEFCNLEVLSAMIETDRIADYFPGMPDRTREWLRTLFPDMPERCWTVTSTVFHFQDQEQRHKQTTLSDIPPQYIRTQRQHLASIKLGD